MDREKIQADIQKEVDRLKRTINQFAKWAADDDGIDDDLAGEMTDSCIGAITDLEDIEAVLDEMSIDAEPDLDAIHEAICEGRKQDALDLLSDMFPKANFRRVADQNRLFPDRVIKD
jgi:hypothetical protein